MRAYKRTKPPGQKAPLVALTLNTMHAYGREIFRGIMDYALKHNPWHLLAETQSPNDVELPHAQGLLLGVCSAHIIEQLQSYRVRTLLLSGRAEIKGVPVVRSNDRAIGKMGARHLMDLGLRKFCFVSEESTLTMTNRRTGFAEELESAGMEVSFLEIPFERSVRDRAVFQKALVEMAKPVGIMAATDLVGCLVIRICREAGIRVPDEVAVIGVQNDELLCATSSPPLTSIRTGADRIGYEAARLLDVWLRTGNEPKAVTEIAPIGVVQRQSTDTIALSDAQLAKAVAFIRNHAMDPCNVNDVVRHMGGGRRSLEVKFREVFQRTPHEEIQRIRIEGVQHLLQDTDLTVEDIASRCGFGYLPNLVRAFRQSCKCTPTEYRKANK